MRKAIQGEENMRILRRVIKSLSIIGLLTGVLYGSAAIVSLEDISRDNSIIENDDGIKFDIKISKALSTDTFVTVDFSDSTATANEDFRLRYQLTYADIGIDANSQAVVKIPAGTLSVRLLLSSIEDCKSEGTERVYLRLVSVDDDNVSIFGNASIFTDIEDTPYDDSYYYVSVDGDDGNEGSCENPVRKLSTALYRFRSNDKTSLIIKNGIYNEVNITHALKSGTEEHPIVIRAQYPGNVTILGNRSELERDGSEDWGLMIQASKHVVVKGIQFVNHGVGLRIYDSAEDTTADITVENCTFKDNGHVGISMLRAKNIVVKNSTFIGSIPNGNSLDDDGNLCEGLCAIQDYGVAVYLSKDILIEKNYFYGRFHQALSFKEGDENGQANKNIFVGALYTAIFLGQDKEETSVVSKNLSANQNIVVSKEEFPVKSPLRVGTVENATITNNYFQDFDYSNNLAGIFILKEAQGTIDIENNILAFGKNNNNSGAFEVDDDDGCPSSETAINIIDNIAYDVHHNLTQNGCSYMVNYKNTDKVFGDDITRKSLILGADAVDFDTLYHSLTDAFH